MSARREDRCWWKASSTSSTYHVTCGSGRTRTAAAASSSSRVILIWLRWRRHSRHSRTWQRRYDDGAQAHGCSLHPDLPQPDSPFFAVPGGVSAVTRGFTEWISPRREGARQPPAARSQNDVTVEHKKEPQRANPGRPDSMPELRTMYLRRAVCLPLQRGAVVGVRLRS